MLHCKRRAPGNPNYRSQRVSICIFVAICVPDALKSRDTVSRIAGDHFAQETTVGRIRRSGTAVARTMRRHQRSALTGLEKCWSRLQDASLVPGRLNWGGRLPVRSFLRIERRHMRFILVNGVTLRPRTLCMLCCEPIGASYLKEFSTGLSFCGHDCYALYCDRWVSGVAQTKRSTVAETSR